MDKFVWNMTISSGKKMTLYSDQHARDLNEFYSLIEALKTRQGGYRYLSKCTGATGWPERGVYFFFEPGEFRKDGKTLRIVRVGTHALKKGARATLWGRLSNHKGTAEGGNHRGSVFRLHVGSALIKRGDCTNPGKKEWGKGSQAPKDVRDREKELEKMVSRHIGMMPFLWVEIDDEPGPDSDRGVIERNAIALLSNINGSPDNPSPGWLGLHSLKPDICESGLWNLNHVRERYSPSFLSRFREFVEAKKIRESHNKNGCEQS